MLVIPISHIHQAMCILGADTYQNKSVLLVLSWSWHKTVPTDIWFDMEIIIICPELGTTCLTLHLKTQFCGPLISAKGWRSVIESAFRPMLSHLGPGVIDPQVVLGMFLCPADVSSNIFQNEADCLWSLASQKAPLESTGWGPVAFGLYQMPYLNSVGLKVPVPAPDL